jgi:hypothetical protein
MRRLISSTGVVLLAVGAAACEGGGPTAPSRLLPSSVGGPLFHQAGPCNAAPEPGHSEFAQHHVVPLAQAGALGAGGHTPGAHRGFSACNPSGR